VKVESKIEPKLKARWKMMLALYAKMAAKASGKLRHP
jgi:hypothetical protein